MKTIESKERGLQHASNESENAREPIKETAKHIGFFQS